MFPGVGGVSRRHGESPSPVSARAAGLQTQIPRAAALSAPDRAGRGSAGAL